MKRLLILAMVLGLWAQAMALDIAYVVNSSIDTSGTNLPTDKVMVRFLKDRMEYTVHMITDDSAGAITSVDAYDGYFLSATMSSSNVTNLRATTKGVVICDAFLYDDFLVGTGQSGTGFNGDNQTWTNAAPTHPINELMFDKILFSFASNQPAYAYSGIPAGATHLWTPSYRPLWDGTTGDDSSACYVIDAGGALTTGTAAGRRAVALSHYPLMNSTTDCGWCHAWELLGNICGWAWNDMTNPFIAEYNCYSTDKATDPGPEVMQAWTEYGSNWRYIYTNGRVGFDTRLGLMFLQMRDWQHKVTAGYTPDSLIITYKMKYATGTTRGGLTDAGPYLADTVVITADLTTSTLEIDSNSINTTTISNFDWYFRGDPSWGILIRTGVDADTLQKGDTIKISKPSLSAKRNLISYSRCGIPTGEGETCSGMWNGVVGDSFKLLVGDPYGGFDNYVKMYNILATPDSHEWTIPNLTLGQGGNPEGSTTRSWVNRNYLKSGNTGQILWNATDLTVGVDIPATAIDSFRMNKDTWSAYGTDSMIFNLPGSYLEDPDFNWLVFRSTEVSTGSDSTDIEIGPNTINDTRGYVQRFELYLSPASSQTIGFTDTTINISGYVGGETQFPTNTIVNTGDGVLLIDGISDDKSWLTITNPLYGGGGNTPLLVEHAVSMAGTAGVETCTLTVTASEATNSPLVYYIVRTLTNPPVDVPVGATEKRSGYRKQ